MPTVEGSYDPSGYVVWKTPQALYPSIDSTQIKIGLSGGLVSQPKATERGYIMETHNATIQISIPCNTEEGHRKVRKPFNRHLSSKRV